MANPNPRLELLLDAARRGAAVCVLLDSLFDDPQARRSNRATAAYLNDIAAAVGSLNRGEVSHKINREAVLLTDHVEVYVRLTEVFWWNWTR